MAENEYLDSSKARRWQSVAQAIRDECSDEEIADRIQDCFYKTMRAIAKYLPLSDMIVAAIQDPAELARICDGIRGGDDVKDFLLQAAQNCFKKETMLEKFLNDSLNNCLYDIPYLAVEPDGGITISEARDAVQLAAGSLRSDIQRMALKLAENPNWNFRRAGNRRSENSQRDRTKEMLDESLIAGFKK